MSTNAPYHCLRCGRSVEAFAEIVCNQCVTDRYERRETLEPAVRLALTVLLNHVEPGWDNCKTVIQAWLDGDVQELKAVRAATLDEAPRDVGEIPWSKRLDEDHELTAIRDELRERDEELRVVWHAMACAFDHCERCIKDADVIKRVRFRLGPAT